MHNKHRVIEEHIPLVVEFAEKKTSNKLKKTPETATTSHINNRF